MSGLDALARVLADGERFLIASHAEPDGDAVGSALAMRSLLERLGKRSVVYNPDPIPYRFDALPGALSWTTERPEGPFDASIVLDCARAAQLGATSPVGALGELIVVVDHHERFEPAFGDLIVRDAGAAATGELLFRLAERMGVGVGGDFGACVYCCLMSDTGGFRYGATSAETFRIAGALVEAGVSPWHWSASMYEREPPERVALLGQVLSTLELSACGRVAFLRVTEAMRRSARASAGWTDGFVNYARGIRGVEVAVLIDELSADECVIEVRSAGSADVSFLGGASRFAANVRAPGSIDQMLARYADEIARALDAQNV